MLISTAWQRAPTAAALLVEPADTAVARAGSLGVRGVGDSRVRMRFRRAVVVDLPATARRQPQTGRDLGLRERALRVGAWPRRPAGDCIRPIPRAKAAGARLVRRWPRTGLRRIDPACSWRPRRRRKELLLALLDEYADGVDAQAEEIGRFFDHLRQIGIRGFVPEHSMDPDFLTTGEGTRSVPKPARD